MQTGCHDELAMAIGHDCDHVDHDACTILNERNDVSYQCLDFQLCQLRVVPSVDVRQIQKHGRYRTLSADQVYVTKAVFF
jgi:hypothetical protein